MRRFAPAVFVFACVVAALAGDPAPAGVAFETGSPRFADVLAKAKEQGKPVFIDFFTESCGWCKRLDADVFAKAETAETLKAFVAVRFDAEKGEGAELAKRYRVHGYPSLVVVDADGAEIDRIGGYEPVGPFNEDVRRILRGEGTIADARKRHEKAPDDAVIAFEYADKLQGSDVAAAEKLFDAVIASKKAGSALVARARLARARICAESKRPEEALKDAEALLPAKRDEAPLGMVLSSVYPTIHGGCDPSRALRFLDAVAPLADGGDLGARMTRVSIACSRMDNHQRAIVETLRARVAAVADLPAQNPNSWCQHDDAAWTCFLMKRNVAQAIQWARTAVAKSREEPTTLDTLANLLWLTCEPDEAVKLETRAMEKAEGTEKIGYAGTLAKWKVELEMTKALPKEKAEEATVEVDDQYQGVQGPCGK